MSDHGRYAKLAMHAAIVSLASLNEALDYTDITHKEAQRKLQEAQLNFEKCKPTYAIS